MPSKSLTLYLAIAALLVGGLAGIQFVNSDLGLLFGAPPRQVGDLLYSDFDLVHDVHTVTITNSTGERVQFEKHRGIWTMQSPLRDRADYASLQTIVYFSRHLKVESVMHRNDTTLEEAGMRATGTHGGRFHITLKNRAGEPLADYRLGRRTAWHRVDEKEGTLIETFFVRPNEKSRKDHFYVCSAPKELKQNVRQILERGLGRLRDHHPFLFDQQGLADITIRSKGREIVLERPRPTDRDWNMTKPLASRTKPEMVNGLIVGLSQLDAIKIYKRKSITIPPRPPGDFLLEVEIVRFGAKGVRLPTSSKMTVEPPLTPDSDTVLATIDTRPGLVFEIPLKPVKGRMTLSQLPLSIDQLRGRTLANFGIAELTSMTIHQLTEPDPIEIFLGQEGRSLRWKLKLRGTTAPANEEAMARILKAMSQDEVLGFASDAASDLPRYGLHPPDKRIVLQRANKPPLDLRFGRGVDGRFYAMRHGTSTVAEVGVDTYSAIAAKPYHWRDTLLMPFFSIVDIEMLRIETPVKVPLSDPTLTLRYKFLSEDWEAQQYGEDVTANLNKHRANEFLKFMEEVHVMRWLDEVSPAARRALRSPTFSFTAAFRELDDAGDLKGYREASFDIAPASRSRQNRIYYGQLSGDSHFFVLSKEVYHELTKPLVEDHVTGN